MKARITISIGTYGELEVWLNTEGRDRLVRELQGLSETSDHFHLGAWDGAEVELSSRPYRNTDKLISDAKVLFRPDDWDRRDFPHVLASSH